MKIHRLPRQEVLSLKVTAELRRAVDAIAARLTLKRGERVTLTDVLEEAIRQKAEKEGVKIPAHPPKRKAT